MAADVAVTEGPTSGWRSWARRLWRRELEHYPAPAARARYLTLVVLATVMLYYELYVTGAVASQTLPALHTWQSQYVICGSAGLVVFVVALFGLRELSPRLRGQLMVSERDRLLVEARARGIDPAESMRHPWRQVLHLDVIASAFGVSVLLLIYYTMVEFSVVLIWVSDAPTAPKPDIIASALVAGGPAA